MYVVFVQLTKYHSTVAGMISIETDHDICFGRTGTGEGAVAQDGCLGGSLEGCSRAGLRWEKTFSPYFSACDLAHFSLSLSMAFKIENESTGKGEHMEVAAGMRKGAALLCRPLSHTPDATIDWYCMVCLISLAAFCQWMLLRLKLCLFIIPPSVCLMSFCLATKRSKETPLGVISQTNGQKQKIIPH